MKLDLASGKDIEIKNIIMSIGLIGTKLGMTREFIQSGQSVPITVIKIETGRVIDIMKKILEDIQQLKLDTLK